MTDPLIDRDALASVVEEVLYRRTYPQGHVDIADAVLAYLREVLTPEVLVPTKVIPHGEYVMKYLASGEDMRRRILGPER